MILVNEQVREAFYAFVDIRGFTQWSTKNQLEINRLLKITYEVGESLYGKRKSQSYMKRIVKYLGDGFYSVNEYAENESDNIDFINSMNEIISDSCKYINTFMNKIDKSTIHDTKELGVSIGISFGPALRFNIQGQPMDYCGKSVNIASRLCSVALDQEIVMEAELEKYFVSGEMKVPSGYKSKKDKREPKKMSSIETFCLIKSNNKNDNESSSLLVDNGSVKHNYNIQIIYPKESKVEGGWVGVSGSGAPPLYQILLFTWIENRKSYLQEEKPISNNDGTWSIKECRLESILKHRELYVIAVDPEKYDLAIKIYNKSGKKLHPKSINKLFHSNNINSWVSSGKEVIRIK